MPGSDPNDLSLLGAAPSFAAVLDHVSRAAPLDRPVLVIGERGTGKELIAARLHYLSKRWDRPLVKLNCAALAESLLETELFGHEAGSFTGATRRHLGRFEIANEGTLFLDELATASLRIQEKILRVIEYGEFERVGGRETIRTNVRIIAATNLDLPGEAAAGRFREDLLDRLAFDVITLPPLRARRDDILPLAEHFATKMSQELKRDLFAGFTASARQKLLAHAWPGNVRELRNVIERAVYRHEDLDEAIDEIQFNPFESPWRPQSKAATAPSGASATATAAGQVPTLPMDFRQAIEDTEVAWLQAAMQHARFNQRKAAESLSLTYHQLRGYLRKYRLVGGDDED